MSKRAKYVRTVSERFHERLDEIEPLSWSTWTMWVVGFTAGCVAGVALLF